MVIKIDKAFEDDRRGLGWVLIRDQFGPEKLNFARLRFSNVGRTPNERPRGAALMDRARELRSNLGQRHAEAIVRNQQELPEDLRPYSLVFTGTLWRRPEPKGGVYVALIYYKREDESWVFGTISIREHFIDKFRLAYLERPPN